MPGDGRTRRLIVLGDANPDLILRGDVRPRFGQEEQLLDAADLVMGGSGSITACGTARLGIPTTLVAMVGDDVFGRFVTDVLRSRDVDTSCLVRSPRPTGVGVILSTPADRAILSHLGSIPTLTPAMALDALAPLLADGAGFHVHASSFFLVSELAAGLSEVFAEARAAGATTSFDTNWDPAQRWRGVTEVLAHTDVFLPNDAELRAISGIDDLDTAGRQLAATTGATVVAKCGAQGGHRWTPTGEHLHQPSAPVEVVDTTGAGDSFNAGFLAGLLRGAPPRQCLAMAVAAGSLSTRGPGGIDFQPTPEELAAAIAGHG